MEIRNLQTNFTGGELSPLLDGRVDVKKYFNSLYKMENFLIHPQGPASFRPGFKFIAKTKRIKEDIQEE